MKGDIVFGGPDIKSLATNIFFINDIAFQKHIFEILLKRILKDDVTNSVEIIFTSYILLMV